MLAVTVMWPVVDAQGVGGYLSVNYQAGTYTDSGVVINLSADGKFRLRNLTANSTPNVIVDVQGYFAGDASSGGSFTPLDQASIYDAANSTPLAAGESRVVPVVGNGGVPDDGSVESVAMTVSTSGWTQNGYVTVSNTDLALPATSNLSFDSTKDPNSGVTSSAVVDLGLPPVWLTLGVGGFQAASAVV